MRRAVLREPLARLKASRPKAPGRGRIMTQGADADAAGHKAHDDRSVDPEARGSSVELGSLAMHATTATRRSAEAICQTEVLTRDDPR